MKIRREVLCEMNGRIHEALWAFFFSCTGGNPRTLFGRRNLHILHSVGINFQRHM